MIFSLVILLEKRNEHCQIFWTLFQSIALRVIMERVLCEVERKSPRMLLKAIVVAPIARKVLKFLNKMSV